jgi:Calcineurin-like phosphoesterase
MAGDPMKIHVLWRAAFVVLAGVLAGCSSSQQPQNETFNYAYVVLGENGAPVARLLTSDAHCPSIRFDGKDVAMGVRAVPQTMPLRPTRLAPADAKPAAFPVLTCEKAIPAGTRTAAIGAVALPLPAPEINRIVVIGDTGCRLNKRESAYQDCNDGDKYPFARIAASAASWKPDLVLHVGDFEYRENACPADHPGCAGSPWGYGWDAWQADFFKPGNALLKAAPWVLVRGNHESCNRAGQGWWRLLDPRPLMPHRDCNAVVDDNIGDYSDPYAVPLGGGAQLIVLDTSNTVSGVIPEGDFRQAKYRELYREMDALSRNASYNIAVNHHPILGFSAELNKKGKLVLKPGNQGLQSVFREINPLILPPRVNALMSGHVHVWQEVSFSSPHPTQFVAGFSGTLEDTVPLPAQLPPGASPAPGAVVAHHSSWVNGFGYMTLERNKSNHWDVKVWDASGKQVNACRIDGRHSVCDMAQVKE